VLHRYIVIVDDIWDMQIWKFIECALVKNCRGSRIITTTRIHDIAKLCCSSHGDYIYEMKPLGVIDSKILFDKRIFDPEERRPPQLTEVSEEILKKCGGLPLAIISISSLLASKPKSKDQWDRVKVSLSSTLERTPDIETMEWVLSLSYSDLPNHLKTCLLYLSIFPEGYEINRERLVSRWIAEGFIYKKHGQNPYEVGDSYFNELVNRSLIQPANIKPDGQTNACRVDDTVHDFIVSMSVEENFVTLFGGSKLVPRSHGKVRRLSIQNGGIQENIVTSTHLVTSQVRSLTLFAVEMPSLLGFGMLRVLDLEDCYALEDHHLTNLERLVQLRYLSIRTSPISELPKQIGQLQYLETLDLRATGVEELPSTIGRLKSLVRLFVDYHVKLPKEISNMHALEELTSFSALMYSPDFLKELGQLTNMRVLRVICDCDSFKGDAGSCLENLASSLCNLGTYNLHSLFVDINGYGEDNFSLDTWQPVPSRLRRFSIDRWCPINKIPNWVGSLINLEELVLYVNKIWQEDFELLGHMPALSSLTIYSNTALQGRIIISGFHSTKFFKFYCNPAGLTFDAGSLLKLECLDVIMNVFNTKSSNGSFDFGIQYLTNLRNVYIQLDCNGSTGGELEAAKASIKSSVNKLPGQPKLNLSTLNENMLVHEEAN
jgi:Leucine-rich repeat (LRR) protein